MELHSRAYTYQNKPLDMVQSSDKDVSRGGHPLGIVWENPTGLTEVTSRIKSLMGGLMQEWISKSWDSVVNQPVIPKEVSSKISEMSL